jgi:acylpyruvate hydrolase
VKLATIRTASGSAAVRIEDDGAVDLGFPDLGALLRRDGWRAHAAAAAGRRHQPADADYAALVPNPGKITCVGLNYRSHILEMGRELPPYPTLFAKFANALLGANDDIVLPSVSDRVDWEAELGVVIGSPVRRASAAEASAAIAGYTIVNDVSMRDWQWRTSEWLKGKSFEASTPVGPWLVTPDEVDAGRLELRCDVDGENRQHASTSDLLFRPADIIAYASQFTTLEPGDLIATGTPGGVGAGREPRVFLRDGQKLVTTIEGLGQLSNCCVTERAEPR